MHTQEKQPERHDIDVSLLFGYTFSEDLQAHIEDSIRSTEFDYKRDNMVNRNLRQYRNPPLTTIRLLDGNEAQAHVNGTSFDDHLGYAFVDGKEMVVRRWLDGQWYEQEEA